MKVLNLYAGIGGNRKLWPHGCVVTAIERDPKIAQVYRNQYPRDTVLVEDAHNYLLHHYDDFDFIWSSPPCQSHSRMIRSGRNRRPRYPDMRLYEEILFLQHNHKGKWVVENVVPYYQPLVHAEKRGRHMFWANFYIPEFNPNEFKGDFINQSTLEGKKALQDWLGIHYDESLYYEGNHCPSQVLRNAVHPDIGKVIWDAAMSEANHENI